MSVWPSLPPVAVPINHGIPHSMTIDTEWHGEIKDVLLALVENVRSDFLAVRTALNYEEDPLVLRIVDRIRINLDKPIPAIEECIKFSSQMIHETAQFKAIVIDTVFIPDFDMEPVIDATNRLYASLITLVDYLDIFNGLVKELFQKQLENTLWAKEKVEGLTQYSIVQGIYMDIIFKQYSNVLEFYEFMVSQPLTAEARSKAFNMFMGGTMTTISQFLRRFAQSRVTAGWTGFEEEKDDIINNTNKVIMEMMKAHAHLSTLSSRINATVAGFARASTTVNQLGLLIGRSDRGRERDESDDDDDRGKRPRFDEDDDDFFVRFMEEPPLTL